MAKRNIVKSIVKGVTSFADKNSTAIWTVLSVAGVIGTVVVTYKQAPKIHDILEEEKEKESTPVETIKAVAPAVAPVAGIALATAGCIVGSGVDAAKKIADLSTAVTLIETGKKEFESATREVVGDKTMDKIHDKICEDSVKADQPVTNNIIVTGHGNVLCKDAESGRYFYSDPEFLRQKINELNEKRILGNPFYDDPVTLNELYLEIGLEPTKHGYDWGWSQQTTGCIKLWPSSCLTDNNIPVFVMDFNDGPIWLK